jgi:hypothetical protein
MTKAFLRIYKAYDLDEIKTSLLIVGDLAADCGNCRELGLKIEAQKCPECGAVFRYISSRRIENHPGERGHIVKRLKALHPEKDFIDFGDYEKQLHQKKARDFFSE